MSFPARLILAVFTMVATLCSCSTISKRQTSQAAYPRPSQDPSLLLARYQEAKLWATRDVARACALWNEVLAHPQFPLINVARLRAMETCPPGSLIPTLDQVMASTPEPWLADLLVRSTLSRAQRTGDKRWELKLSLRQADNEKLQTEKLKLLTRARVLAKELQDDPSDQLAKQKIEAVAPRFIESPTPDQLLAVAGDFKQAREFDKARETYVKVGAASETSALDKLRALDGIRLSYKLQKKTDAFLEASKAYSDFAEREFLKHGLELSKSKETNAQGRSLLAKYLETRIILARAIWTEGSPTEAKALLSDAEKNVRDFVPVNESLYIRAAIEEEAGRSEKSVAILKSIETAQVTNRDLRTKIFWSRAWTLRKLNRLPEAAVAFAEMVSVDETSSRAKFWLAKTEKDLGQAAEAVTQFESLIATDPFSWYALLSYRELGREMPPLVASQTLAPGIATKNTDSALMLEERVMFEWLLAGNEPELARTFLDQIATDRKAAYSDEQTLDLLHAYAQAGYFQALFARLSELSPERRLNILQKDPVLQFPQPWSDVVNAAADHFGVQSEIIYAIMRQESSFNPLARSGADAFGLMQLIPEMAKRAEVSAQIQLASHEDLYQPELNIQLGTAFVKELMTHWHDRFIPTVASYNASEKAITGWLKSRYRGDVLTFIEDVPYEETRTYIKLVMRNYIFYKRLNSRGVPLAFPEWCLANLQPAKS